MRLHNDNIHDLGLHSDKELDESVTIVDEWREANFKSRIILLDDMFYLYKFNEVNTQPNTEDYTQLYEVVKTPYKGMGWAVVQ